MGLLGGLATGAGHAGLDVDDGLLEAALEREKAEDRGSRVAAGARDELRFADLVAVRLGKAVDGFGEELGGLVGLVPVLVGLLVEPEVGGQVDDLEAALAKRLHGGRGGPLRGGGGGA